MTLVNAGAFAQRRDSRITIGKNFVIRSRILKEDREYWVYLPKSYDDSLYSPKRYPVLYLLDAEDYFHLTTGIVGSMSDRAVLRIPEMIVVAIPNTNRIRDLTPSLATTGPIASPASGGGDKFLRFIKNELFPAIEAKYRTQTFRTLAGHSLGGLLVLHALVRDPEMFNSYIATDPSLFWDDQLVVREAEKGFKRRVSFPAAVYFASATHDEREAEMMTGPIKRFGRLLDAVDRRTMRIKSEHFDSEDHGSVPLQGLYHGLLFTFDGYRPNVKEFMEGAAFIDAHYKSVSARVGTPLRPPESLANELGYFHIEAKDYKRAIDVLKLNVLYYPNSYNAYDSLADAYRLNGETALAIQNYQISLKLRPTNKSARKWLAELTKRTRGFD